MADWDKPQAVSDWDVTLGTRALELMPAYRDIPEEFRGHSKRNKWLRMQSDWFFKGIKKSALVPKPGIDAKAALRHLSAIQGSFEPSHEHKKAGVAYLASLWFEDYKP